MLAFFRRVLSSWLAVAILGVIMIAFIITGVGTPGGGLVGGPSADAVATIGRTAITLPQAAERVQAAYRQAQQQQPGLTLPAFLDAVGGVGPIVDQLITGQALSVWATRHGIAVSPRQIDGELAGIPAFQGPTGQFDQKLMMAVLQQQRMSYPVLRDGIRDDLLRAQVLGPITIGATAPTGLLEPYARLLIDRREGAAGLIPLKPQAVPAPTDADIAAWYAAHKAAYSLPERRVVRYAVADANAVTVAPPSDAEIAAAYKADAAKYAASETRKGAQVVLPDEAAAKAFAAKVAGGTAFAQAATQAGFTPADIAFGPATKAALAQSAGAPIADAAFALKQGGTSAPIKTALGWTIVHVDAVTDTPARSLDQARGEIATALTAKKKVDALSNLVQAMQDQVSDGANFADVARKNKLTVVTTPPVLANGTAPSDPAFRPDATLTALMKPAAQMTADDEPTVETIAPDRFALLGVQSVVPAAPIPLAQVKPRLVQDLIVKRATDAARAQAQAVLAKVRGGQPLAAALAAAGLPAPQPIAATQVQVAQANGQVPAPVRGIFRLAAGKSDIVPNPGGGFFVVTLDRIVPGDAKLLPAIVAATRGELVRNLGEEYAQAFANAARAELKVTRNPAAVAKLDQQLRGRAPADGQ